MKTKNRIIVAENIESARDSPHNQVVSSVYSPEITGDRCNESANLSGGTNSPENNLIKSNGRLK